MSPENSCIGSVMNARNFFEKVCSQRLLGLANSQAKPWSGFCLFQDSKSQHPDGGMLMRLRAFWIDESV